MPGHIKKSEGPDPDPSPWLEVSEKLKNELKRKPYEAKKSCWVPDKDTGGFIEGLVEKYEGDKAFIKIQETEETVVIKRDEMLQVNPPKFDCSDDMAMLTYLNDACVLWNSVVRYKNELIYTYSGLFCIAINPYKRFPIYTQRAMDMYFGKRRNEAPPHIFAVAEESYQGLMNKTKNQSILITGESGAGKTENTKKVIAYFASIGASGKKKDGEIGLEEKIVQTNPVLEGWGNAKTVRNDNSSRFGKFIRIWFNQRGKLSGSDMVVYLLEKSRLTFQAELERCYHSFYMLISGAISDAQSKCLLTNNIYDYWWVSQGKVKVDSIDDSEEMQFADQAYDILGFSQEEKYNIYKLTAVVMHMGNFTKDFVPVGKEEQAEVKHDRNATKIAELCGIDIDQMCTYFCKPKLKVGGEWVSKGQTCPVAASSVAGIARKIYELVFNRIVERCNENLIDPKKKKVQYIGCLDIAGFEIFDFNGFEQICINFCNEKLQQFFNNHMFVLEQEEYLREGISWKNVDFGMNLEKCISMFEKPMGLLAILEEESLFPKATDMTLAAKLMENLYGKCDNFQKANPKPDPEAHFAIVHYAGTVSYNLTGWLEKNKDPLNDTIVEVMKHGSNKLLVECFIDHPGQPLEVKKNTDSGSKKKGGGKTVSSFYRSQLDDLMKTLYTTDPSFIRCVVPNTHKKPGMVEPGLVMHQYRCNGVLAGIAICRKGFPNKMIYADFKARYNILAADASARAKTNKGSCKAILESLDLEEEKYRLGHTKVFFRAGTLGYLEELREERIGTVLSWLTAMARGKASRMIYQKMAARSMALICIQKAIRSYLLGRNWLWWELWLSIKPNLRGNKFAELKKEFEEKIHVAETNIDNAVVECNKAIKESEVLAAEKNKYEIALRDGGSIVSEVIDKTKRVEQVKSDLQKQVADVKKQLKEEEKVKVALSNQVARAQQEEKKLHIEVEENHAKIKQLEEDGGTKDDQIRLMKEELVSQEQIITLLTREKRSNQDKKQKTEETLQSVEDKCNHLNKVKVKLEQSLDEVEDDIEREKKCRCDAERMKRKIEGELRLAQDVTTELSCVNNELSSNLQRKEKEIASVMAKIDDEKSIACKYIKQQKELNSRLEEIDDELSNERSHRTKADQTKLLLSRDIEDLSSKLEDAGNKTSIQMEMSKRREEELSKLNAQLEENSVNHEALLAGLRQKHNNTISEMKENIDQMHKMKNKVDNDKGNLERDLNEDRINLEESMQVKAMLEKNAKATQGMLVASQQKLEELSRAINEADSSRKKLQVEGQDLERQIEELETKNSQLSKEKASLTTQVDDVKRLTDAESREKSALLSKFKSMFNEVENLKVRIDEESEKKSEFMRALSKANADIQLWKSKHETEGLGRVDELESAKSKITARIQEGEETIESITTQVANLERINQRLQSELEEIQSEYERVHTSAAINEQRGRNYDKVINEWQLKVDDISAELEASQNEMRNYNSENFRLKACWEEATEQLELMKRENKNLADEIKDLLEQLGEGGRSIHELDKQRRRLQVDKDELQEALEEAEATLEQEENKSLRIKLELGQVRQEIDGRIKEKEEEFENIRKIHARGMDSLQASIDAESKAKSEAIRIKKILENDINELEIAVDHANKANIDAQKGVKRHQNELKDVETKLNEEQRQRQDLTEKICLSERKGNALQNELDEVKSVLDSSENRKKQLNIELEDVRAAVNEMQVINAKDAASKRQIESKIHTLRAELDESTILAKNYDEKTKKTMVDAARLHDELRTEQDHVIRQDKAKKSLEYQLDEFHLKLTDTEEVAMKGGRAILSKQEAKIHELELMLANCQMKTSDATKAYQRAERSVKELEFQKEEDKKNHDHMVDLVTKLQRKIKTYKEQIEEAEEIAALNLSKYRKAQQELEETEERTKLAELKLNTFNGIF